MTRYLLLLLPLLGFASSIKMEYAQLRPLGQIVQTNALITQLSDQKQKIVSRLSGHLEAYYIKPGQHVSKGDKVVLIESIELSKMTAEYLSFSQQYKVAKKQKNTAIKLHKKGLSSQNDVNNAIIALEEIRSQNYALSSQLNSLGINPKTLKVATDQFILYAHADGDVGEILAPMHSNVDAQTPLATLVNQSAYYAVAYINKKDAMKVTKKTTGWIDIANESYTTHFVQLLPNIDEETQRAKVLFQIENAPSNLLLGAFIQINISFAPTRNVVMVKKSALTLFKGEWVVFIETNHEGHDHDENIHTKQKDAHGHDKHEEDEEPPYKARVVKVIAYTGNYVAIEGLKVEEEYVSDGVYFVKSMLLRSSLGGHGH